MATVLYVDDDEILRLIGTSTLELLGHSVVVARDAEEALAVFDTRGDELGLGVIDMSMPGMKGDELIAALRERGATMPLLVCTGYDYEDETARAIGASGVLRKPFRMKELEDAVSRALRRAERVRG